MNNNPMTEQEARDILAYIKAELVSVDNHLRTIRELIVDLHQRQGWKALDYPSWRQCVIKEFTHNPATLYRQLHAGLIEQIIGVAIGDTPEAHLRSMTDLTPEATSAVWQVVKNTAVDGNVTAAHVKAIAGLCRDVFNLGVIDVGEGEQIPVNEATPAQLLLSVNQDQLETIMRQKQHVRDAMERKHGASTKVYDQTVDSAYMERLADWFVAVDDIDPEASYRMVIYKVEKEKELK